MKNAAGDDNERVLPIVNREQELAEWRENEGADAAAADGDSRRQRPLRREVVADRHDRRQEDQAAADAA